MCAILVELPQSFTSTVYAGGSMPKIVGFRLATADDKYVCRKCETRAQFRHVVKTHEARGKKCCECKEHLAA